MFGVSKETQNEKMILGLMKNEWSMHLFSGWIYHDENNKEKGQPRGNSYGYMSQEGDTIICVCDWE